MNLTKNISAFLLIFLMSIISSTTYAATEKPIEFCGYLDQSKDIDGFSSIVCPQNKSIQLRSSFFGEFGLITYSQEFKDNVESLKNEQQKAQDKDNQKWVNITNAYIWKLAQGVGWIMFILLIIQIVKAAVRGEFSRKQAEGSQPEKPAKYDMKAIFFFLGFVIVLVPGIMNGMSIAQNITFAPNNLTPRVLQAIIQSYLATKQRGDLEFVKETTPAVDSFYENGATMSRASAVTYSMVQKAVLLKINSNLYNFHFNTLNKSNYKLYDDFKDVIVDFDPTYVEFIKSNPEKPSEDLFRLGGFEVFKSGDAGVAVNSYMKDIEYDSTYGTHYDIDYSKLISEAESLKRDLRIIIDERGEDKSTYETVVNSAISKYFYDVRSNWLKRYIVEQANNGRFDKLAYAVIEGACAENPAARLSSESYLKERTGSPVCLTKDWKVAGNGKVEDSKKIVAEEINAIRSDIYSKLITINTALRNSIANPDLDAEMKEVLQCGVYCFIQRLANISDRTAFTEEFLSIYNNRPFYTIFDVTATDSYIRSEWLKNNSNFDEASYPLQINNYMKNFMTVDYQSSGALPVADSQTLMQTSFVSNSAQAVQNKNFENANTLQLESVNKSLGRIANSATAAQTGIAMYGEQLIHIGEKGIVTVVAGSVVGSIADKFVTNNSAKSTKETAKVGDSKKTKGKKNTGALSSFSGFFNYVANLVIPAMGYLIILGGSFAYVMPVLAKLPFLMLTVFADYYSFVMTLFVTFLMYRAVFLHTVQSFEAVARNYISLIMVNLCLQPLILLLFIVNFHITDIAMKAAYPVVAFNFTDSLAQTTGVIGTTAGSIVTLIIAMYVIQMSVLYATLAQISKFLKHYKQDFLFSQLIISTIEGFLWAIHIFTGGITMWLSKLVMGMTNKKR
ncbi:hypothetical protein ACXM5X_20800 [Pseudomonas saponiphila]